MPHDNILRVRIACWKIKTQISTQNMYVVLIAFPQQVWLRERAAMSRLYIHTLSVLFVILRDTS